MYITVTVAKYDLLCVLLLTVGKDPVIKPRFYRITNPSSLTGLSGYIGYITLNLCETSDTGCTRYSCIIYQLGLWLENLCTVFY